MYPFIRLSISLLHARGQPKTSFDDVYESHHRVMPWDMDLFGELNNGLTLTLLDLNRLPFGQQTGWNRCLLNNGWAMTMAGVSVRYRKRIRMFEKVRITCRSAGRDDRFFYLVQTIWSGKTAATNAVYRCAVTNKKGLVPTQDVAVAMGAPDWAPELPAWVRAWIDAEAERTWPPES
ncbi:MAG: thioesterase family protein [Pseudomonadota bacterium]